MMPGFKYSVNTNGLSRKYSRPEIVKMLQRLGADGIEWGLPKLDEAAAAIKEMAHLAKEEGLEVAGYINGGKLWKRDEMRRWAEVVASGGGKSLRVSHPWIAWDYRESLHQRSSYQEIFQLAHDAIPECVELSRKTGVRFLVEMHSGALTASALAAANLLHGVDPQCFGVIYDPANSLLEGNMRPRNEVEVLGPYLGYVHAKNVMMCFDGRMLDGPVSRAKWTYRLTDLDCGMLDWVEVMFALKAGGYQGFVSSEEYFQEGDNQEEQIRRGVAFLKACEQAAPAKPEPPFSAFND